MNLRSPTFQLCCCLSLGLTWSIVSAQAGPSADKPPSLDRLLQGLTADKFEAREDATTQLMLRADLTDARLTAELARGTDPEQRQRLLRIALHLFYVRLEIPDLLAQDQSGALGVSFPSSNVNAQDSYYVVRPDQHPMLKHPAMLITQTYPGFPAYVHLRPGDLVTGMNGRTFPDTLTNSLFSEWIKAHKVDAPFTLELIRRGKARSVELKLGHRGRLLAISNQLAGHTRPELFPPWLEQRRRLLAGASDRPAIKIPAAPAAP
ncbi:MAG: hypothetical protein OER86_08730 [Phycisphaerae bacterium]|nr:hypothetical protein [Phycisphaerae bacterium]